MGSGASSQPTTPRDHGSAANNDGSISVRESRRKSSRPPTSRSQIGSHRTGPVNYGGGAIGSRSDARAHPSYSTGTYARLNPGPSQVPSRPVSQYTAPQGSNTQATRRQAPAGRDNQPTRPHHQMHHGTRSAVTREDEIVLAVKDAMTSKEWVDQFQTFLYHNSIIFEDTEDNKLSYTETHNSYKTMIEGLLNGVLRDMNASEEDLLTALAVCEPNDDPAGHAAVWILQVLLASEDFPTFKTLMIQCNRDSDGALWRILGVGGGERDILTPSEIISAPSAQTDTPSRQFPSTANQPCDRDFQGTYHNRDLQEAIDTTREQARWHENMVEELETEQIRLAIQMSVSDFYRTQMRRLEKIAAEVHRDEVAVMSKRKSILLRNRDAGDAGQCTPEAILESQRLDLTQQHLEARREILTAEWDRFGQLQSIVDPGQDNSSSSIEAMQESQETMKVMVGRYDQTTMQQASKHTDELRRLEVYSQSIHRVKTCLDGAAVPSSTREILIALEGSSGNEKGAVCQLLRANCSAPKDTESRLSTILDMGVSLADAVAMLVAASYDASKLKSAMDDLEAKKNMVDKEKEHLNSKAERIRAEAAMMESERSQIQSEKDRLEKMREDLQNAQARDRESVEEEIKRLNVEAERVRLESEALHAERSELEALKKELLLAKEKEKELERERELERLRENERLAVEENQREQARRQKAERQKEEDARQDEERRKQEEMQREDERRMEAMQREENRQREERLAAVAKRDQELDALSKTEGKTAFSSGSKGKNSAGDSEQGHTGQLGDDFARAKAPDDDNHQSVKSIYLDSSGSGETSNEVGEDFKHVKRESEVPALPLATAAAHAKDEEDSDDGDVGSSFASVSRPRPAGRRSVGRPTDAPSSGRSQPQDSSSSGGAIWHNRGKNIVEEETTTESGSESEGEDEELRTGRFTKGPRNMFQRKGTPRLASGPLTSDESSSGGDNYSDCDNVGENFDKERVPGMRGHQKKDLRVDEVDDDEGDQSSLGRAVYNPRKM